MKIKITSRQFKLLMDKFHLIGDNGLELEMTGKTFKKIMPAIYPLNEQKMFKVNLWFGVYNTVTIVQAHNSAEAVVLTRKMFPKARVFDATPIKGKLC